MDASLTRIQYDGKDIDNFERDIEQSLQNWITYIEKNGVSYPDGACKDFEIGRSIQYHVTDMICLLCFGYPFGFVAKHADCFDFLRTLEERLPMVEKFSIFAEVNRLLVVISHVPLLKRILPSATDTNERDLAELEITIALFAGSDTTATSIRAILLHVITNPLVYGRLQREIDSGILDGTISSPAHEDEVRRLPYLQACIREGLRVFPPITYLRERVTPKDGDTLNGFLIPAGVNIGFNLPGLLLNEVFGTDARSFRPERWLDQESAHLRKMERTMDLIFGWGSTRCLGIRMANANQSMFFVE
ncbi:MAG: hypothetical protein Q9174_003899, partial [Haloplaca sp. 1 TL-2023]